MLRALTSTLAALALFAPVATAHEAVRSGDVRVVLGWETEPALTAAPNAVEVMVRDRAGAPLARSAVTALTVEVRFGDAVVTRALEPAGRPGSYRAALVPTRPGIYAFHVSGTVSGRQIDVSATCSDRTFDCVSGPGDLQFPAREPTATELATRVARADARARAARADARSARRLAGGTVVAAGALAALAGLVALQRRRR